MYNIDLKFGIGGNEKIASSSELVNDFLINSLNDLGAGIKNLLGEMDNQVKELIVDPEKS